MDSEFFVNNLYICIYIYTYMYIYQQIGLCVTKQTSLLCHATVMFAVSE